jgi:hypothetical protein
MAPWPAPEPEFEDASLGVHRGSGPEIVDQGMYGEDRWVTACEREEKGRGSRTRERLEAAIS